MPDEYETLLIGGAHSESEEDSFHITSQLDLNPITLSEMKRDISPKNDQLAYRKIAQIIDWFKPDIIHTHASKAGALGRLAGIRKKVPILVHTFHGHVFHSYFNKVKTQAYISIERRLAAHSDAIIAISPLQKKELVEDFKIASEKKTRVIPLGFDLSRFKENKEVKRLNFRNKYFIADDCIAIGIIGRLVQIKNHDLFLEMAKSVQSKTRKKVKYFIIGDGDLMADLKIKALSLNLISNEPSLKTDPLFFTSWIKNIDEAIAGLDIIVMTSKNEGTPVSLIEAQAGERAIVSTEVGGIKDIIVPGESGFISQNGDIQGLTGQLLKLIEEDKLRAEMGRVGYNFVREKFTYQRLANDMDKLYKELLREKKHNYFV
jgi:glycosyltransferase involved in cell wall biosynthesis